MEIQEKVYTVFFNADLNAVVMEWKGYATSRQFRQGTELMLNTLIHHQASKVLADIVDMPLIGREDQQWLDTEFLPRAIQFGFKSLAILQPINYFNKVAVESISYKVDSQKLCIGFFDSREDAEHWLEKV